jgi:adenine-specific DNA-methyltransferase
MKLTWDGRGRPVVRDAATGRWGFGERGAPGELVPVRAHGAAASLLVEGDAQDALAALGRTHAGRFRLCYIDPPFNTGGEFATYSDRASHEVWLSGMEERLTATLPLLTGGGFLVVHINAVEHAYLKVLLDELLGRDRMVAQVSWQRAPDRTVLGQGSVLVADHVEYLLIYARGAIPADWPRPQRRTPLPEKTLLTYGRVLVPSLESKVVDRFADRAGAEVTIHAHTSYSLTPVPKPLLRQSAAGPVHPTVAEALPGLMRLTNQQAESTFQQQLLGRMPGRDILYRAEFTQTKGKHQGARSRFYLNGNVVLWLRDVALLEKQRLVRVSDLNNFWTDDEIPSTGIAGEGGVDMRRGKKPERLLERVITAFSRPGDWVLDYFGGSGTTGAVAERLGRPWVMVEAAAPAFELAERRLLSGGASFQVVRTAPAR